MGGAIDVTRGVAGAGANLLAFAANGIGLGGGGQAAATGAVAGNSVRVASAAAAAAGEFAANAKAGEFVSNAGASLAAGAVVGAAAASRRAADDGALARRALSGDASNAVDRVCVLDEGTGRDAKGRVRNAVVRVGRVGPPSTGSSAWLPPRGSRRVARGAARARATKRTSRRMAASLRSRRRGRHRRVCPARCGFETQRVGPRRLGGLTCGGASSGRCPPRRTSPPPTARRRRRGDGSGCLLVHAFVHSNYIVYLTTPTTTDDTNPINKPISSTYVLHSPSQSLSTDTFPD